MFMSSATIAVLYNILYKYSAGEIFILIFSVNFMWKFLNPSRFLFYVVINVLRPKFKVPDIFFQLWRKLNSRQNSVKFCNIKFHDFFFRGNKGFPCWQTDVMKMVPVVVNFKSFRSMWSLDIPKVGQLTVSKTKCCSFMEITERIFALMNILAIETGYFSIISPTSERHFQY
jgi:hypothetical protein